MSRKLHFVWRLQEIEQNNDSSMACVIFNFTLKSSPNHDVTLVYFLLVEFFSHNTSNLMSIILNDMLEFFKRILFRKFISYFCFHLHLKKRGHKGLSQSWWTCKKSFVCMFRYNHSKWGFLADYPTYLLGLCTQNLKKYNLVLNE